MAELPDLASAKPNQIWIWVGGLGLILSLAAMLGISGFGVEVGEHTQYAPLIGIFVCIFVMYYGTQLARNREIAMEERRKAQRPHSEPTEGDLIFLAQFRAADGKMSAKELEGLKTPHDAKKTKDELLATVAHLRMEGWIRRGKCLEYGNTYFTREAFENSQDMTVIQ